MQGWGWIQNLLLLLLLLTVSCDQSYLSLLCIAMLAVPKNELF